MAGKIGLQIYSIRDIYGVDPVKAFAETKKAGYDAVDMFGQIKMSAPEMKKLLDDNGLECCGWHMPWDYNRADVLEAFVEYNKVIGNKYLIVPGLPKEYQVDSDAWKKAADKLNEIAAQLKKHGMYTGMHSHRAEFMPTPTGDCPWDIIAKNTTSDVVLQLDMGNTYEAGVEPVAVLKKYAGRYQTIHLKPFSLTKKFGVPIGEDDIDWAETIKFCKEKGNTEYFIVEYEVPNAIDGVKTCCDYIRKLV